MTIKELVEQAHANAVEHGFWDKPIVDKGVSIALMHAELSEALEELREARPDIWYACKDPQNQWTQFGGRDGYVPVCVKTRDFGACATRNKTEVDACRKRGAKPEGVAIELADCVLRIADYCGQYGIDLEAALQIKMEYNQNRPYRHGKVW